MPASRQPFPDALRALMEDESLSFRRLAELTKTVARDGRGLSHSYLGHLARGAARPTIENIELISRAAGVEPTYFREYREHLAATEARRLAAKIGLEPVLEALRRLEGRD